MMNDDKYFKALTDDPQLKQMADEVQQAYELEKQEVNVPSVDEAWRKFNAKHHVVEEVQPVIAPCNSFWKRYGVAASILLVCMVAVAVTLVRKVELGVRSEEPSASLSEESGARSEVHELEVIEENETTIIYRNIALSQIVEQLALAYDARVEYLAQADVRLYVELDRSWSLQECVDFLNHFDHVNLSLTADQVIEVR